jgi:hypothetical protein
MTSYSEPPYDDQHCAGCGATLPETVEPLTWQDHGFCNLNCAMAADGGFRLQGKPALELAEFSGRQGGPGFERDLVRDWIKAATPNAPIILGRFSGESEFGPNHSNSWIWRLYSGGVCRFMRMTAK